MKYVYYKKYSYYIIFTNELAAFKRPTTSSFDVRCPKLSAGQPGAAPNFVYKVQYIIMDELASRKTTKETNESKSN